MNISRNKSHNLQQLPKKIISLFIILFLIVLIGIPLLQLLLQYQTRRDIQITSEFGIDTLISLNTKTGQQWLKLRGKDRRNPIILFLHGGPGAPLFPDIKNIGVNIGLEDSFVMAYWEQPGTGKSFQKNIPDSLITIDKMVNYAQDVTNYLRQNFNRDKIYLMARSWGSLIGLKLVLAHPELFEAYIGIGQLIAPLENDRLSYQYTLELAEQAGNQKALQELQKIGLPPYNASQVIVQRHWLTHFYYLFMEKQFGVRRQNQLIKLLSTREYSLADIIKMGSDPFYSIKHLWNEELYQINFLKQEIKIDIPVIFVAGKYDYYTPAQLTRKFYNKLLAPAGKELLIFDSSGHHPELEQPEKFRRKFVSKMDSLKNSR